MRNLLKRRIIRQFVKFGVVGASSTVIDWGIFYILIWTMPIYYLYAKVISFSFALLNSFIWNRRWTFRSKDSKRAKQFTKFLFIALIGLSLNTLIMYIVVNHLHHRKIIGLICATAIVTFWNFLANKLWVFKGSEPVVIE